jgi:hydrophobic/amphiphilic exporter-1 (mainly G- bacteria), HAE1 family
MVVDNAIVVIENIFTHMQQGKSRLQATIDGTQEVSGGILAATLANVAVFAPLVLVTGEVSQLFIDMAITITAAAVLSMFACLTFLPMLASLVLDPAEAQQTFQLGNANTAEQQAQVRRNWLEGSIVRTSAAFRQVQSKLESFLLATVGWALGPRRIVRRLALLSIPIVLLVSSIFLLRTARSCQCPFQCDRRCAPIASNSRSRTPRRGGTLRSRSRRDGRSSSGRTLCITIHRW